MLVNRFTRPMPFIPISWLCRLTITGLVLTLSSCAPNKQPEAPAPAAIAPRVVGEIAVVDEEKRFVLIDLESHLYVPAPGTELRATNAQGGVAHLKASPEQKRPFVAADIVDGDPAVGDEVVR